MTAKTIVLTGASDGIGAAATRQLVADGHTVVLVGRSPQKTAALAGAAMATPARRAGVSAWRTAAGAADDLHGAATPMDADVAAVSLELEHADDGGGSGGGGTSSRASASLSLTPFRMTYSNVTRRAFDRPG